MGPDPAWKGKVRGQADLQRGAGLGNAPAVPSAADLRSRIQRESDAAFLWRGVGVVRLRLPRAKDHQSQRRAGRDAFIHASDPGRKCRVRRVDKFGVSGVYDNVEQDTRRVCERAQTRLERRALEQVKRNKTAAAEEDKKVDAARVANTKPTLVLRDYVGSYSDDLYGAINITEENGRLVMRFSRSPNFVADLDHWHYDTFQIKWRPSVAYNFPRGFVTFTIDKNGKTEDLKIAQPNNDFWFYELDPKRVN